MKKIIMLLSLLFIVITTSSCSKNITEGEVFNTEYKAAHTDLMWVPIVYSDGKTSYTTMMPVYRHYPDTWIIYIKSYDEDKQKWLTEDYYVSKNVYDEIHIGDWFIYDKNLHKKEQVYTQEQVQE